MKLQPPSFFLFDPEFRVFARKCLSFPEPEFFFLLFLHTQKFLRYTQAKQGRIWQCRHSGKQNPDFIEIQDTNRSMYSEG